MSTSAAEPEPAVAASCRLVNGVIGACLAAGLAIAAVGALSSLLTPSYVVVASGMPRSDLAEAAALLDGAGIAQRIDVPSAAALVPPGHVAEARRLLEDAGLVALREPPRSAPVAAAGRSGARRLEQQLAADVERLLFVRGGVAATVVVRARLDHSERSTTSETYERTATVPLRQREGRVRWVQDR